MSWRRTTLAIAIGAVIINVAVAWGSALLVPPWAAGVATARVDGVVEGRQLWSTHALSRPTVQAFVITTFIWMGPQEDVPLFAKGPADDGRPNWLDFPFASELIASGQATKVVRAAEARGWPFPCLWSDLGGWHWSQELGPQTAIPPRHGIAAGLPTRYLAPQFPRHPLTFPLRPIWPAFVANCLLYAALLSIIPLARSFLHRSRRRHARGRCVRCGYQLGTLTVCPECGFSRC